MVWTYIRLGKISELTLGLSGVPKKKKAEDLCEEESCYGQVVLHAWIFLEKKKKKTEKVLNVGPVIQYTELWKYIVLSMSVLSKINR